MDVNFCVFVGRLTADPEKNTVGDNNTPLCRFTIATNERIGRDKERTTFVPVAVWGKDAENCGEYLSKGREVRVAGRLEIRKYTDREGVSRKGIEIIASEVRFGSGGKRDEETTSVGEAKNKVSDVFRKNKAA